MGRSVATVQKNISLTVYLQICESKDKVTGYNYPLPAWALKTTACPSKNP